MALTWEIDPQSEDAANVPLTITSLPYRLRDMDITPPDIEPLYASSVDTEGDPLVSVRHRNRHVVLTLMLIENATDAAVETAMGNLVKKLMKLHREGGTLKMTTPAGTTAVGDVVTVTTRPTLDQLWPSRRIVTNLVLDFECRPYFRGALLDRIFDDFATDTITAGNYTFDTGGGTLSVSGGLLVPSSTATKRLLHTSSPYPLFDSWSTVKVTTGASVASGSAGVLARRLDANNWLTGLLVFAGAASTLIIQKFDAGALTTLVTSGTFTTATSTSYWVRLRVEGNVLTVELFTSAPSMGSVPAQTVTTTLAGADITKFGQQVAGRNGISLTPVGTDYRADDLEILPYAYKETALPVLTFAAAGVGGDVPATGRLIINNDDANNDQRWLTWGLQSRRYDPAATAALFYEAEALTPQGGSTTGAESGASGGNGVLTGNLTYLYQSVLSTQLSAGAGAHLTHVGRYRVYARIHANTTNGIAVSLRLQWADGDFRNPTLNDPFSYDSWAPNGFMLVDLGLINIRKATQGTQRWEGRILARSTTANDNFWIDYLMFVPVDEESGIVNATTTLAAPTVFAARDEFNQTAGALAGKVAPVGGTWAKFGAGADWQVDASGHSIWRSATLTGSDYETLPAAQSAGIVQVDFFISPTPGSPIPAGTTVGVVGLFNTGTQANVVAHVDPNAGYLYLEETSGISRGVAKEVLPATWYTLRLYYSSTTKHYMAWLVPYQRTDLMGMPDIDATGTATPGGTSVGIYDQSTGASAVTRYFDNFVAAAATPDAAIYAGGRSMAIDSDRAERSDSAGVYWNRVASYEGNYLQVPPAGKENRVCRFIMKGSRNLRVLLGDNGIDDLSARLMITPRYLVLPS